MDLKTQQIVLSAWEKEETTHPHKLCYLYVGTESGCLSVYKCCADLQIHGLHAQSQCLVCLMHNTSAWISHMPQRDLCRNVACLGCQPWVDHGAAVRRVSSESWLTWKQGRSNCDSKVSFSWFWECCVISSNLEPNVIIIYATLFLLFECIFHLGRVFSFSPKFLQSSSAKDYLTKTCLFFFFFFKPLLNTKNFSWIFRGWWKTAWERCLHSAYDMKSKPRKGILSRLSFCPVVTFKYSTAVMANPPLKWVILPGIVLSSQIAFHILIQKLSQTMFLPLEYAPSGQAVFANKPERKSLA